MMWIFVSIFHLIVHREMWKAHKFQPQLKAQPSAAWCFLLMDRFGQGVTHAPSPQVHAESQWWQLKDFFEKSCDSSNDHRHCVFWVGQNSPWANKVKLAEGCCLVLDMCALMQNCVVDTYVLRIYGRWSPEKHEVKTGRATEDRLNILHA